MSSLAQPPLPPGVSFSDDDRMRRLRLRLVQVMASSITIVGTVWLCMLDAIVGIIGLMVAKHILVAVLMMEVGVDGPRGRAR